MRGTKFYQYSYRYLAIGLVIVFWGFSQSYFGNLKQLSLPYHIHGISASMWIFLVFLQPLLYSINRLKLHKFLGWFSVALVLTLVSGGFYMMKAMIHNQANYPPDTVYQLAYIDATTLLGFITLYGLAIYFRKDLKLHSRFMVATLFGPLIPAITRIFFIQGLAHNFNQALTYSYLLTEAVLALIIWKERKHWQMKLTYLPVLIYMIVQHMLMYFAGQWSWWIETMNWLASYS